jgi:hypothetical protein
MRTGIVTALPAMVCWETGVVSDERLREDNDSDERLREDNDSVTWSI